MLNFAIYVSDHGFGHATRMAALAEEFIRFGIFVHIRSARPDFIFAGLDSKYHQKHDVACDLGVKHGKNLAPDLDATKAALLELMGQRSELLEREVEFLRREGIDLIISDIPWLPVEAGTYAGVPVFAVSNFDWLFIYERLFEQESRHKPVLNTIFGLYQRIDHAFRLPLSSVASMAPFRRVEKTGLLARKPRSGTDIKAELGIATDEKTLLCSFGGAGEMEFDLERVCAAFDGTVISLGAAERASNHIQIPREIDFSSLVAQADVFLTKPGYSSFSEAIQSGTHLIYRPRTNYPEEEILIKGIKNYPHKTELSGFGLSKNEWKRVFEPILDYHGPTKKVPNANAKVAGLIVKRFLELKYGAKKLRSVFDVGSNNLNYCLCAQCVSEPLHTAQTRTGLGTGYRNLGSESVKVGAKQMAGFKKAVTPILTLDKALDSEKSAIATGISRNSDVSDVLLPWFEKRWNTSLRVIGAEFESELSALAAEQLIPQGNTAVIVDIGGFSTEITLRGDAVKKSSISLPMGLLTLSRAEKEGLDVHAIIQDNLQKIPFLDEDIDLLICVGLSAVFLAKIALKQEKYRPDRIHGTRIGKKDLLALSRDLDSDDYEKRLRFAAESRSRAFIKLSALLYNSLMDRFGMRDFIVCHHGISWGYNLWIQRPKRKKK